MPATFAVTPAAEESGQVVDLPLSYVRRRSRGGPVGWIVFALVLAAGLVAGGVFGLPYLKRLQDAGTVVTPPAEQKPATPVTPAGQSGGFPRRMLVLNVTRYLYCNRLAAGTDRTGDAVTTAARRLAFDWRIPADQSSNQLYILSDTAADDPRPMLKPLIVETLTKFCETSRPQDRVVIYFGGHAAEVSGKAYLVPAEGELADATTLLPLDDFWAAVKECKAAQRVVLFDVCRLNEDEDKVRPGSDPMTPGLEKALLSPPGGVEVVISCAAGQTAAEFRRSPAADVTGSLFLSSLKKATGRKADRPKPEDPFPVATWVDVTAAHIKEIARATGRPVQTPKRGGEPPASPPPADPDAPPVPRFDLPFPPKGAPATEVEAIVNRITLPPIREAETADDDRPELLVPFPADVMKDYRPADDLDADKFPHRQATVDALATITREWGRTSAKEARGLRYEFAGETNDRVKKTIEREQEVPARIIIRLEQTIRKLDGLAETLDREPSRYWRAAFQYALAQAKARLAFMHEYNLALGLIRTDSLPEVDKSKGQDGLQLVSVDKMKSKKKELADEARELFGKIAADHKGTPFAVAAKRSQAVALGLEWRPYAPGKKGE
jgi:hypothetical protein